MNIRKLGLIMLCFGVVAWDFSKHSIPLGEILSRGPSKDGIPAIDHPRFVPASKAARTFTEIYVSLKSGGAPHREVK